MVNLVGTWSLVSLEHRREDGQIIQLFGKDAIGLGTFTEDGYFFSSLMPSNRPKFTSKDVMGGTKEEKASAVETHSSYCGRYEVQGNKIIQHVEMSLFPNWVGGKQERFFEVEGERLIISSPPMLIRGEKTRGYSIWERV
jgi:hypothetical protein